MNKLPFLFIFFAFTANGQLASYKLSEYIQPEVRNKFNVITPSYHNDSYWDNNNGNHQLRTGFDFYLRNNINNYNNLKNSNEQFSLFSQIGYSSDYDDERRLKGMFFDQNSRYNKNFFFKKNKFIGFGIKSTATASRYNYAYSSPSQEDDLNLLVDVNIEPEVSIGVGRIQNIQDAWLATVIFEVLKKNDLLKREFIEHQEITDLADLLSNLRNVRAHSSRFFDNRLLTNKQFEIICNHLIEDYFVESDNPMFYALLYDTWRFENFQPRLSNNEFRFGIVGQIEGYYREIQWRENPQQYTQLGPKLYVQYQINKPMGLKWQFSSTNRAEVSRVTKRYQSIFENSNASDGDQSRVQLSSEIRMEYLESLRTTYYASFTNGLRSYDSTIDVDDEYTVSFLNSYFTAGFEHYFSPVLRFSSRLFVDYSSTKSSGFASQLHSGMDLSFDYFLR